jgi:hypothetical protein
MIGLESARPWAEKERRARPGGALLPLRVLLFGLAAPLLLRRRPERMAEWLETATADPVRYEPRTAEEMAHRVDVWLRAGWPLIRRGCLTRGAAQLYFLRRAGFPVSLRFGIGEVEGRLDGHCWLVLDGEPFAEKRDPRSIYTETWRIPRDR